MRRILYYFYSLIFLWLQLPVFAQPASITATNFKEEQEGFTRDLKIASKDTAMVYPLARYFESETDDLYNFLIADPTFATDDKEKAIRSLVYFIRELGKNIAQKRTDMYDIPGALASYKKVITALLYHRALAPILQPLAPRRSQLLAAAFSQYKEYPLLDDIAVFKRVSSAPEFIFQFLENKPRFRYADTLFVEGAAHDPIKLVSYLKKDNPGVQNRVRLSNNVYIKQIAALSEDKNVSELLPFIIPLTENKITREEILEKRKDVLRYFQLLVNTLQESKNSASIFLKPLRSGIRQKSLSFYVNEINDLHSSAESVRFASVKGLRPEDIYYIITSSGEELYTSSYLGLYKRLLVHFPNQSADSLFDIVNYDNFRVFMRLAANYNVLADFLHNMPPDKANLLVKRFIAGVESDPGSGLEKAMDIADSFPALSTSPDISGVIQSELESNLTRCQSTRNYLGIRLYTILLQVFDLTKSKNELSKLWTTLGNYELLKRTAMENKGGEIVQLVLFYGDDDGTASFSNFLRLYADSSKWKVAKNENWVSISSRPDPSLVIYANRPLDISQEMDLKAQDSLIMYLTQHSLLPSILVHRGHSYHLDKTLKRLTPSVKLAILGSCGGYNKAISIASVNPDVQVIGSKKTGSMSINDPIIDVIDETLASKNDLLWSEIWKKLTDRFSKDGTSLSLFNEYFPPSNNVSLFVLKLFYLF